MIENNNEPNKDESVSRYKNYFPSIYDAYNSIMMKSGGLEKFQKEIIQNDPSLDGLFKADGYPTDVFKSIDKKQTTYSSAYSDWLQLYIGVYSYHFQSQRINELKNSLTGIDSKLNEIQGTVDKLEDEITANTAAIAKLEEDLTARMKKDVGYIVKNDDDNTDKILKALP